MKTFRRNVERVHFSKHSPTSLHGARTRKKSSTCIWPFAMHVLHNFIVHMKISVSSRAYVILIVVTLYDKFSTVIFASLCSQCHVLWC